MKTFWEEKKNSQIKSNDSLKGFLKGMENQSNLFYDRMTNDHNASNIKTHQFILWLHSTHPLDILLHAQFFKR